MEQNKCSFFLRTKLSQMSEEEFLALAASRYEALIFADEAP